MLKRSFKRLTWLFILIGFILALSVLAIRFSLAQLHLYTDKINDYLSQYTASEVHIDTLVGGWHGFYPQLSANTVTSRGAHHQLVIKDLHVALDWWGSLQAWSPVFHAIDIGHVNITLDERAWLPDQPSAAPPTVHAKGLGDLIILLSRQARVSIPAVDLVIQRQNGATISVSPIELELNNTAHFHQAVAHFTLPLEGSRSQVELIVESPYLAPQPLESNYAIYAKVDELGPELLALNRVELPFSIRQLKANAQLWGRWQQGHLSGLQGRIQVDSLAFNEPDLDALEHADASFMIDRTSDQQYSLTLDHFAVQGGGRTLDVGPILAKAVWKDGQLTPQTLGMRTLDLEQMSQWFQGKTYLDTSLRDALDKLKPTGQLEHLSLTWHSTDWQDFTGVADLVGVSMGDYYGAPALTNINGRLNFSADQGSVDLVSNAFGLHFPQLFSSAWQYEQAKGKVFWKISHQKGHRRPVVEVNSTLINLANPDMTAAGRFGMYLPLDRKHQAELTLLIAIKDADARLASQYVPASEVGQALYDWVDTAVQGGHINQGMLLLHTGTRSLPNRQPPTVQLYLDVDDAAIRYQPKWPALTHADMRLSLAHQTLQIVADQGRLLNTTLQHLDVALPAGSNELQLNVSTQGPAADIQSLLTTSLRDFLDNDLEHWSLSGQHQTKVALRLPLSSQVTPDVQVSSQLANVTVQQADSALTIADLVGRLQYRSGQGLSSDKLHGFVAGQPTTIDIKTVAAKAGIPELTRVTLAGKVSAKSLHQWTGLDVVSRLSGETHTTARLDLCQGSPYCNKLVVSSSLQGIAIDAPLPIGKTAQKEAYFQLIGHVGQPVSSWRYNLNHQLRGVTIIEPNNTRSRILLGGERPAEPTQKGIYIAGRVEHLDIASVHSLLANKSSGDKPNHNEIQLAGVNVNVGQWQIGEQVFNDIQLVYHPKTRQWTLHSGVIQGAVTQRSNGELEVNLDHLAIPESMLISKTNISPKRMPERINLDGMPPLQVVIKALSVGPWALGEWQFKLEPEDKYHLNVNQLQAKMGSFLLTGKGGWYLENGRMMSYIDSELRGKDLGALLSHFGYADVLEAQQSSVNSRFYWRGYPWQYDTRALGGTFAMQLENGRVIESGNTSNILRLFGILNLNTLARRLRLNFRDLVEKGISFDEVTAQYRLKSGLATTVAPVKLTGPSANIEAGGQLDLVQQTLDSQMKVVLPFTNNIPIAAVLLGAPQVAGAAFIIDKLIGDKLEKVSALQYHLSGNWENPSIEVVTGKTADTSKVQRTQGTVP